MEDVIINTAYQDIPLKFLSLHHLPHKPLSQSEPQCPSFHMKMRFHSQENETHFHMKAWALAGFTQIGRHRTTQKCVFSADVIANVSKLFIQLYSMRFCTSHDFIQQHQHKQNLPKHSNPLHQNSGRSRGPTPPRKKPSGQETPTPPAQGLDSPLQYAQSLLLYNLPNPVRKIFHVKPRAYITL